VAEHPVTSIHTGRAYRRQPRARVLLMTATVTPPPNAVTRSDPKIRVADYCDALAFYLTLPADRFDRIVFADNSASDLGPMLRTAEHHGHDKAVELLSFQANDHAPSLGKAYGEFRLIDKALELTQLVESDDRIWKTTGRLQCRNLEALDAAVHDDVDVACDLHNVPFVGSGRWRGGSMMDLRLFAFRRRFHEARVRGRWASQRDAFDAALMYRIVLDARRDFRVLPRFPRQPIIAGRSGRTDRDYRAAGQRIKDGTRGLLRRVAPALWL
jgi:hypothetical protein